MFDFTLFRAINDLAGKIPVLDALGIFSAAYLIGAIVIGTAAAAALRRNNYIFLAPFFSAGLGYFISQIIGLVNFRPRPFVFLSGVNLLISKSPLSKSFPSDHATFAFAFAASLLLLGERRLGIAALIMAFFVALGRVYVGVHFPLDVAAGAVLGTMSAYLVNKIFRKIKKFKS